jgi:hypothetical protein
VAPDKETFFHQKTNPGMFSRIAYTFDLPDYSPSELALIFKKYLNRHGWSIGGASSDEIAEIFVQVPPTVRKDFNGTPLCALSTFCSSKC